ncbi:DUF882 domain-containing protein [Methylobacterium sp. WL103]|uniref:DUF882 domain-containing protein n=1 Tax=Methylobacterium sp. WL103 TaxID=2603891 RepID=UPI001FEF92E8|nr:DUF882 domain-containing protein [Methylobacterium sp. WL103]
MVMALAAGTTGTQDAVANGDTRSLTIFHTHTKESATITFKRDGRYDRAALEQLNWLLRDWRIDEPTKMDPRLFDTVWEAYRQVGASEPIHVVSAYRSPGTNAMLRRRSKAVAEYSQHMLGKAMDFYLPGVSIDDIRAVGLQMQRGGVGWYPHAGSPFVHLDVGSVRMWPRMSHDQLARLFPDGKTVHLASDNRPFPRYEEARAEILARGGTVLGVSSQIASADEEEGPSLVGFLAGLFGGRSDPAPAPVAAPRGRPKPVVAVASADPEDTSGARAALAYAALERPGLDRSRGRLFPSPDAGAGTAIYDISARTVRLPGGEVLEAHSGLGASMDHPDFVHLRMRGSTPPGTYDLTEREALFHGVRAIRLNPVGGSAAIHGRDGLLAHTYMLGPSGASNGCVSFRNYDRFLQAFLRGEVRRLVVVAGRGDGPARFAASR